MTLLSWGSWGYQVGALGIVAFTLAYLMNVRWWTDWLGRVVALVLSTMSGVLFITTLRQLNINLPGGILLWRVIAFWLFGLGVWIGLGTFIWAQFIAPRTMRKSRLSTRRELRYEEGILAARRSRRDGDPDDDPAGEH